MSTSAPGRVMRWATKTLLWLIVALVVLLILGAIYQIVATRRDRAAYPPPGEMVAVGDYELHIDCVGRGSPTVVLEAALGYMSAGWVHIQDEVAKSTRVCAYDRAGMGWSEPGPAPRDAEQGSSELHALLTNAGVEGPYVVVGHSLGGLYTLMYAARYPEDVAGVALVDSSHPGQFDRLPGGREEYERTRRLFALAPWLARVGALRFIDVNPAPPELPAHQRAQVEAFSASTQQMSTTAEEFRTIPQTTSQVRSADGIGDKPLAVVSAGEQTRDWLELQKELAALSSASRHRIVDGATHLSLLFDGRNARETSAAILEVVEAVS
jgi:pimeloyl-ACP methyl ester carboxylesterase